MLKIREVLLGKALDPLKSEARHSLALVVVASPSSGALEAALRAVAGGFLICAAILSVLLVEKLSEGGWATAVIIAGISALCIYIRNHYREPSFAMTSASNIRMRFSSPAS